MQNKLVVRCAQLSTDSIFEIPYTVFPGGEINLHLPYKFLINTQNFMYIEIKAWLANSEGVMALLMLKSAIDTHLQSDVAIHLSLGYLPYARQDRICNSGETEACSEFINLINNMAFHKVHLLDIHNENFLSNIYNLGIHNTASDMLIRIHALNIDTPKHPAPRPIVIAPDEGAKLRASKAASILKTRMVQAHKVRDSKTGKLSGFSVDYNPLLKGVDVLIVDDICDGGGTFIGLTEVLYEAGVNSVSLYVSHGIFSKGLIPLYAAGITHIYTTDSICNPYSNTDKLTIIKW